MDRLEKAKVHKAIDDVLEDHVSMLKPTRVMIRELILDALESAGFTLSTGMDKQDGAVNMVDASFTVTSYGNTLAPDTASPINSRPHPLDYGKLAELNELGDKIGIPNITSADALKFGMTAKQFRDKFGAGDDATWTAEDEAMLQSGIASRMKD